MDAATAIADVHTTMLERVLVMRGSTSVASEFLAPARIRPTTTGSKRGPPGRPSVKFFKAGRKH
jgi:hypothetical protein